ncbi:hypothetical protein AOLI_G00000150, partial [Acnodon oligacanthus]
SSHSPRANLPYPGGAARERSHWKHTKGLKHLPYERCHRGQQQSGLPAGVESRGQPLL